MRNNRPDISFDESFKNGTTWTHTKEVEVKTASKPVTSSGYPTKKRDLPRPCYHCGGNHWDVDCKDSKKDTKKVLFITADGEDEKTKTLLDDEDIRALRDIEAIAEESSDSEESENESKVRRLSVTTFQYR